MKTMRKSLMKSMACYLVVAIIVVGIIPRVYGGFSPSEFVTASQPDRLADLQTIQRTLEMKAVQERLEAWGFSGDEIQTRLERLDDQQIHQLALQIDELRVGQDTGSVIIVLLIILLVVVLYFWLSGQRVVITR
jgi:hypothetical protein